MKIVEKYAWSRTAEEDVMQDGLSYDGLYTKLSASPVIWENEMTQMGQDPDTTDDRRMRKGRPESFIGYGAQHTNPSFQSHNRPKMRPQPRYNASAGFERNQDKNPRSNRSGPPVLRPQTISHRDASDVAALVTGERSVHSVTASP